MTPSPDRLAAVEARCNAATEGPWTYDAVVPGEGFDVLTADDSCIASFMSEQDAAFLTNAKTDIPWLIESLKAALAERDAAWRDGVEAAAKVADAMDRQLCPGAEAAIMDVYASDVCTVIAQQMRALQPADRTQGTDKVKL